MILDDLKTGMIVKTRDGDSYMVMRDFLGDISILADISNNKTISRKWIKMSGYTQDLTCTKVSSLDIMSVYSSDLCEIDIPRGLLWERKEYKEKDRLTGKIRNFDGSVSSIKPIADDKGFPNKFGSDVLTKLANYEDLEE